MPPFLRKNQLSELEVGCWRLWLSALGTVCFLGGKIISLVRNSWSRHLSLTYNQKYEYVLRVTWVGYEFFGTLALGIYLLQVILVNSDVHKTTKCLTLGRHYGGEKPGNRHSGLGGFPPVYVTWSHDDSLAFFL